MYFKKVAADCEIEVLPIGVCLGAGPTWEIPFLSESQVLSTGGLLRWEPVQGGTKHEASAQTSWQEPVSLSAHLHNTSCVCFLSLSNGQVSK